MQDQNILKQAVIENLAKDKKDRLTCKQLGAIYGVSGPRMSQIAAKLKVNQETETQNQEVSVA